MQRQRIYFRSTIRYAESRTFMALRSTSFRGNKSALPSKPCAVCGRTMSWRKCWEKNWAQVKYCSAACRRNKARRG